MENLRLSDDSIGTIAKLLQIAILTGTDIVDNLRTVTFTVSDDKLVPTQQFLDSLNKSIEGMIQRQQEIGSDQGQVSE